MIWLWQHSSWFFFAWQTKIKLSNLDLWLDAATLRECHKSDSQHFYGSRTRRGRVILFLYLNSIYLMPLPSRWWIIQINAKQSPHQGQRKLHTVASFYRSLGVQNSTRVLSEENCVCTHKCLQSRAIHYDFNRCSHYSVSALFNLCLIGVMPLSKYELSRLISSQRVAPWVRVR